MQKFSPYFPAVFLKFDLKICFWDADEYLYNQATAIDQS